MTQKKDGEVGFTVFDTVQCESEDELGVDTTALFFCDCSFSFALLFCLADLVLVGAVLVFINEETCLRS